MEAEIILEKLMSYFNVINYSELAHKIGVAQQNISKWKSRNSVSAIKIKCRELGIYNDIFGDLNSNINNFQNSNNTLYDSSSLLDVSSNKNTTNNKSNFSSVPQSILIELNSLFERIKIKAETENDKNLIKKITYEIEDFINDLKKTNRD